MRKEFVVGSVMKTFDMNITLGVILTQTSII